MIHCANAQNAELVIVSRDADYGIAVENKAYVNDHLRQEFSERVSKKRKLLLYVRLSEALKHFAIPVTPEEEQAEFDILEAVRTETASPPPVRNGLIELIQRLGVKGGIPQEGREGDDC